MQITPTILPDVLILCPTKHHDQRGFFSETFKNQTLIDNGINLDWCQDNHSVSLGRGVVRGLHFQRPPFAQAKLIRVTRGAILDVAVDIRRGSPTHGKHVAVELSEQNWQQLLIPIGFAHGFCTLTEHTEVQYKVTCGYQSDSEGGLLWNDPQLGIDWKISDAQAITSPRDNDWSDLASFVSPFAYSG